MALHVVDVGAAEGAPVLFLHGLLFDSTMWDEVVQQLSAEYRCIAVDLPGHGHTPIGAGSPSMDEFSELVVNTLDELGIDSVHLVGFSMGGFVALRLAARSPGRVQSLSLIGTSAGPERQRVFYSGLALCIGVFGLETAMPVLMPRYFSKSFLETSGDEWRRRLARGDASAASRVARSVIWRPSVERELEGVQTPTLVVRGSEDTTRTYDESAALCSLEPGTEPVQIEGAGHSVPVERPAEVAAHVRAHLDRQG